MLCVSKVISVDPRKSKKKKHKTHKHKQKATLTPSRYILVHLIIIMADESLHTMPLEHNIDYHIVTLFERLEAMRKDSHGNAINNRLSSTLQVPKRSMQAEIRTLEFWR